MRIWGGHRLQHPNLQGGYMPGCSRCLGIPKRRTDFKNSSSRYTIPGLPASICTKSIGITEARPPACPAAFTLGWPYSCWERPSARPQPAAHRSLCASGMHGLTIRNRSLSIGLYSVAASFISSSADAGRGSCAPGGTAAYLAGRVRGVQNGFSNKEGLELRS